ncbi:amino acid adenylation domain-containing protein [Krasilnikovia cinnamomea]|uniref:Amino acid adenylation domain-containing protein n=1 Tax=Krasilnikovia cinnamomea TaxID=349313 RepID=A0A4Q7ZS96_9ACTN|nr:SDR family NAD(P)-dependent oxidoreductase [Krasilnikovia cinnamomea]RZU53339.1 amino acid adenylation domain-containing protein [Krasilnikovia cinnamomea]
MNRLAADVAAQARRTPDALAVLDGAYRLTYAGLDAAATCVAQGLRNAGVRPGDAVAISLPRSWRLVAVLLGISRLGCTAVPLDAASPPDRRGHMRADSGSVLLVDEDTVDGLLLPTDTTVPPVDSTEDAAEVSFVFYTSGTTGQPKGVEVRDAGILRLAEPGYLDLSPGLRFACLANPAFDALSFEVWVPLLTGGCCVIIDAGTGEDPAALAAALRRDRVDVAFVTVALFNAVVDQEPHCFAGVGQVLVGGEQLNAPLIRRWYRDNPESATRLYNVYGPTEVTTFALCHPIPRDFSGDVVPIGRPLPGTSVLLDGAELLLGGPGVAAGYRNRPQETAARFVELPGHPGRWYRTGDLVRTTADGDIEYTGRVDRQVKVRGFRIEPGELERRIVAHPDVRQAFVCSTRHPRFGTAELVAFVVAGPALTWPAFDEHLRASLPAYMRPHRVHRVGTLPRNANGKIDQDALLALGLPPWRPAGPGTPATPMEREVLAVAGELLGAADLTPSDTWIRSGGDSLLALRLRFAVRERWGCELGQAQVLTGDFAALAAAIERAAGDDAGYPVAGSPSGARSAPATSEQERLWLLQQQDPASCAYSVGFAFELTGPVDVPALRAGVRRLVEHHPALRTAFAGTPEGLRQEVAEPYDPWVDARPGEDWTACFDRLVGTPFDLADPRLLRVAWLPGDNGGTLVLNAHHIAVDGQSINVLLAELSAGSADGQEPHTPLDFAHWQQAWFAHPEYERRRKALAQQYAETPETAVLEPGGGRAGCGLLVTELDADRRDLVVSVGARLGLTRFEVLLGLFGWSVHGVTGRTHPRVASPVAGRPDPAFAASVGMFANTVLLPLGLDPGGDLASQLTGLAGAVRAVLDRQDVALAHVLADTGPRGDGRLFDFLFVLDNTDFTALDLPGCVSRPLWRAPAEPKCPLTLSVIERPDGLDCLWEFADDAFTAAEVEAMAGLLLAGLDRLTSDDPAGPGTLADLVAPYRATLPEPGLGTVTELAWPSIAEGFARQVRRTPDAVAVVAGEREVTYAQLDAYADALAAELPAGGPGPARVALHLDASVEHVVALLALARLNLTAVPLDPAYPPALLRQVLDQAEPLCVLVPGDATSGVDLGTVPQRPVRLTTGAAHVAPGHHGRPLYTLFTSGSTGTPKGVDVSDELLANLLQWQVGAGDLPGGATTQQFSMLAFDVSFQEIYGTLCGGGTLHLIAPGRRHDLPALLDDLDRAGIERIHLPYVALQLLAETGTRLGRFPTALRDVVTAGEQLVCTPAIRQWFSGLPGARLHNHYGPTETHVVSALVLDGDPAGWPDRPAIGRPVANTHLRVIDAAGTPVPHGCPGELWIGGAFVRPAYLGDPALNTARYTHRDGLGWFFRSGDRVYTGRDGLLHFLGRADQQVKLGGYRVELGQVEAALLRHPAIVNAVVVRDGDRLVACVQSRDPAVDAASLDAHLAGLLPAYVRIDRYRLLAELPRTASGKLDRLRALTAAGRSLGPAAPAVELSPLEARLTGLFQAVTGRRPHPDQRFFDAGATSLDLMRFQLRCSGEPDLDVSIGELFEHVTIRRLAAHLSPAASPSPVPAPAAAAAHDEPIAVVGIAVNLPGAPDLAAFWAMVTEGRRGIEYFPAADGLVGARSQLDGLLAFDPGRFGLSPQEARLMDPQQRHLLMTAVAALAHAGIADPSGASVGLVAACGENTYFQAMLRDGHPDRLPDPFQLALHHDKDFLATKVAYHLDLTGPAFTVQAACASSLVAVHVAAGLLRSGDAEVMLAGGVLVDPSLRDGYRYRPQHIFSVDGHCRAFSADATGTVGASGVGVVVLKPLRLARRDGDTVYAVITGSALNNDGAAKMSYSAPSLPGQRDVIRTALRRSGYTARDLGYVEAHGTGTELGDPVEVGALRQALDLPEGEVALATVKSQLGHLGAAAGVVGLIRAVLAVHHGVVPPSVDFDRPNPRIGPLAPFYVPTTAQPWPAGKPRVAGVSSFGIGGTNAHLILAAPDPGPAPVVEDSTELVLSSPTATALRADADRVAAYLETNPGQFRAVLRHLRSGRPRHVFRIAADCPDVASAVAFLRTAEPQRVTFAAAPVAGPAQPPWDFPPPTFDLADYDFLESGATRLPAHEWLRQPHWVRRHRAKTTTGPAGTVVVVGADLPDLPGTRIVRVAVGERFARLDADRFTVDPAEPASLRLLVDAIGDPGPSGVDWLHALPLAVTGPVDTHRLDRARWACLDTPAALLKALPGSIRIWWLSHAAQPVEGSVSRPELGLLAGACEVAPQESGVDTHWLDLPDPDPRTWAAAVLALLGDASALPRRLALRSGYWWEPQLLPVRPSSGDLPVAPDGVYLVLGGTGGIGSAVAEQLLAASAGRVLLLARRPGLPDALRPWADRITVIAADLSSSPLEDVIAAHTGRLDGIVHAAGEAAGAAIAGRDAAAMGASIAGKLAGALLVERLIARFDPVFAVYCSSMASLLGGVGQLDYAAANGLLDGFARHRTGPAETTVRSTLNWDVWRDTGMARDALAGDERHQAHLAVGLTRAEGQTQFGHALRLGLPQLLINTTDLDTARGFYEASRPVVAEPDDDLAGFLGRQLGRTDFGPADCLYDLGADSLTLLDLIAEVKERYGVGLDLSDLSHRVSLGEILDLVAVAGRPSGDAVDVSVWQHGTGRDVLCLIHPVGGDIGAYRPLVAALGPALSVCLIADPGLRDGRPPGWSVAERAKRYLAALDARFPQPGWRMRLGGWSFGAWVALAMAAEAEAAGRPVAALNLLDPPPPDAGPALGSYDEQQLATVFAAELSAPGSHTAAEHAQRLARCCRANLAAMAEARLPRLAATPARLWLATGATAGLPAPVDPAAQWTVWRDRLPGDATWEPVSTTHYGIVQSPHVTAIAQRIEETP